MLEKLRKRIDENEQGFTLIELMVVVLIIAILLAIAIPTFLGAQDRARDRGAQSNLRNALTAAKTIATDNEGLFTGVTATSLAASEGSLTFNADGTVAKGVVEVVTEAAGAHVVLAIQSASDTYFGVKATSSGAVTYCKGADLSAITAAEACNDAKW